MLLSVIKNNILTIIFAIIIISYFIKGMCDLSKVKILNNELNEFLKEIKEIKEEKDSIEERILDKKTEELKHQYFNNLFKNIENIMDKYQFIKEVGEEYFKELKIKRNKGIDASLYFNEEEIIFSNFNVSKIAQKSSSFVGMGLFGTFVGITLVLWELNGAETVVSQISLIDRILPSMSLAFITSILGIFCSLIYNRYEKSWIGEVSKNILKVENLLNKTFPNVNDITNYLENMEMTLKNLTQGLSKNLGTSVAQSIGENTRTLFNGFNKEVNNLGNEISSKIGVIFNDIFNKEFIEEFKNIQEGLKKVNSGITKSNKAIEALFEKIPMYEEKFEKLNDTSMKLFEASEMAIRNYDAFLVEVKNINNTMQNLNGFKDEVLEMLKYSQTFIVENSQKIEILANKTYGTYERIGLEIKEIIETEKKETEILLETHESILKENIFSMNNAKEEVKKTLSKLDEKIQSTEDILKGNLRNIEEVLQNSKDVLKKEYSKMNESQETLALKTKEALKDYDTTFSKLNNEVVQIISNIKDMGENR